MHYADPSGVCQPCRVGMMHECSTGDLPGLHSCIMTTNGHDALKHYATLKGLMSIAVSLFQGSTQPPGPTASEICGPRPRSAGPD